MLTAWNAREHRKRKKHILGRRKLGAEKRSEQKNNNGDTSYYGNLDLSSILYTEPISVLFDSHSRIYNLISGSIEYEECKFINEVKNFGLQQPTETTPDYFTFE